MITLNKQSRLYVIENGNGYSCLGFDVLEKRYTALASELIAEGFSVPKAARRGTLKRYAQYQNLVDFARDLNTRTGWRSNSELTPELIGLEGRRVEVITKSGDKARFQVGKSTGFIPCHLMIARANCYGGPAVYDAPFQSVRVIR